MKYSVEIREDDRSPVKGSLEQSLFMIAIVDDKKQIIGIPLRCVAYPIAVQSQDSIFFAFKFGHTEALRRVERFTRQLPDCENRPFDEDLYLKGLTSP